MNDATTNLPRRRLLGSAIASALGLGGVAPARPPAAPAPPVVEGTNRTLARSGVFWINGNPRRLLLLLGQPEDIPEGEEPPGCIYGDFFDVEAGPVAEFALEHLDIAAYPFPGPVEIRDDPPPPAPEHAEEDDAPTIPVPGPLVADEDRREIEGALEELAGACRAVPGGVAGLFGYVAWRAASFSFDNNALDYEEPAADTPLGRLGLAFDGV